MMTPIRCTQNPTMGEEWRRGWHPERIRARDAPSRRHWSSAPVRRLEAATALGRRGYDVVLAEATRARGAAAREARLPGLAAWIRVLDFRACQIDRLTNVELAFKSRVTAAEILFLRLQHVAIATGASWRGRRRRSLGIRLRSRYADDAGVLTPDDLMEGRRPARRRVVLFDDDHYYLGGVLAELPSVRDSASRW